MVDASRKVEVDTQSYSYSTHGTDVVEWEPATFTTGDAGREWFADLEAAKRSAEGWKKLAHCEQEAAETFLESWKDAAARLEKSRLLCDSYREEAEKLLVWYKAEKKLCEQARKNEALFARRVEALVTENLRLRAALQGVTGRYFLGAVWGVRKKDHQLAREVLTDVEDFGDRLCGEGAAGGEHAPA